MTEIVDYELFAVPPRWQFLRLETSDGRVGWGEPVLEGRTRTVQAATSELLDQYIVGADPSPIADHWEAMYRSGFYRGGPVLMSALAGIDQALWDLKGKALDAPVHELLGGPVRERVRAYRWIGGDRPADVAAEAEEVLDAGYTALKMNATAEMERIDTPEAIDAAGERIAAVREAVGEDFRIAVDCHGRVSRPMAPQVVDALAPHDPFFVEEPVPPEHSDALGEVATGTSVPIAAGERLYHRTEFAGPLADGLGVVQPDPSHAGGITECHRIGALAGTHDAAFAPHCPLGPVALATCLQLDAAVPNALIQEGSFDIHYNETAGLDEYLADPDSLTPEDGFIDVPTGPGLGVDVDEARVRDLAGTADEWHNPVWRHADGGVAEW